MLSISGFQNGILSDTVSVHCLKSNKWSYLTQRIKVARRQASGCMVGNFIYLVCGFAETRKTNQIERMFVDGLSDTRHDWELFNPSEEVLGPRTLPILYAIGDSHLAILGGQNFNQQYEKIFHRDVLLLDCETQQIQKIKELDHGFEASFNSVSELTQDGKVYALGSSEIGF